MSQINLEQKHLNKIDTINYGSYYTPKLYVDIAYNLISKYTNIENYTILDTSCGYGNFLRYKNSIGADIDKIAVKKAKQNTNCFILEQNALLNVTRKNYNISDTQKLIIVGNPPYNDTTSIINNSIKQTKFDIDKDLRHRDLGISFLLSYNKLYADYICILHPLSYLIKKTNFNGLRNFTENYKLIDNIIISSNSFSDTSKITAFPIVIALYKRDNNGMTFEYIKKYKFKTINGKVFSLSDFDIIDNYMKKYPNKKYVSKERTIAYFYTMRDINALKRTKSFIDYEITNSIRVVKEKFPYYCYVDCFKDIITHIPYYFGNCNIPIDNKEFIKIKDSFIFMSCKKHKNLSHLLKENSTNKTFTHKMNIDNYFKNLLGGHYVN